MRNKLEKREKFMSLGLCLDRNDIHKFNDEFTSRYADRLSKGEDLKFVWEFELGCVETGLKYFELDKSYTNLLGLTITVRNRREDFIIVEYEGELYEADYGHEDGVEFLVLSDALWYADSTPDDIIEDFLNEQQQ